MTTERIGAYPIEREARLVASLNHPNIAGIYGIEEDAGHRFLVLEYVEGETLADRIAPGPIPLTETLELCRQVAAALEAAHEGGVVHRDLKPANPAPPRSRRPISREGGQRIPTRSARQVHHDPARQSRAICQ